MTSHKTGDGSRELSCKPYLGPILHTIKRKKPNSVKPDLTYSGDTYRPATFDENGVYQGGDTADTLKGDSL